MQAGPRGLFKKSMVVLTTGETAFYKMAKQIQDGTVIGARGRHSIFAEKSALNDWFQAAYRDRFGAPPNYASYHMLQAFLGTKAAWDKATIANSNSAPSQDQVIAAFENMTFESPAGTVRLALGKGHQAITETVYGQTKVVKGQMTVTKVKRYPAEQVNPPEGVKSAEWIASGLKKK